MRTRAGSLPSVCDGLIKITLGFQSHAVPQPSLLIGPSLDARPLSSHPLLSPLLISSLLLPLLCPPPPSLPCPPPGIAPNITAGPTDSAVIDGTSVILHCETSGAPRPAITWQKGGRSQGRVNHDPNLDLVACGSGGEFKPPLSPDRKSTRLNSSHL